jgi:para-nitrobenzyl esterase
MRVVFIAATVALAIPAIWAANLRAADSSIPVPASPSVETTNIGALLDNPATRSVLLARAPALAANAGLSAWRDLTLRDVQKLVGPALSDEQMDAIQADFDKLPRR